MWVLLILLTNFIIPTGSYLATETTYDVLLLLVRVLLQKKSVLFHGRATTETKLPPVVANSVTDVRDAGNVKTTGSGVVGNVTSSSCGRNNGLFAGKSILVVDDAVSILKLMSHTLINKAEAIVTQAKDGQQAVEECEKQHFDLILTDIQMPVLDGFGEARCIRAMEKERGLPRKIIIGISANTQVT